MKSKKARTAHVEKQVVDAMVQTGNQSYASWKAGVDPNSGTVSRTLQRPAVKAEIARRHAEILFNDILPLAIKVHREMLEDPKTPAAARAQLIKLAYDRTLGSDEGAEAKEPHEMTPDELAMSIQRLKREASNRAKPIVDALPILQPEQPSSIDAPPGLFD